MSVPGDLSHTFRAKFAVDNDFSHPTAGKYRCQRHVGVTDVLATSTVKVNPEAIGFASVGVQRPRRVAVKLIIVRERFSRPG